MNEERTCEFATVNVESEVLSIISEVLCVNETSGRPLHLPNL